MNTNKKDQLLEKELLDYFSQYTNDFIDTETRVNIDLNLTISEFRELDIFLYKTFDVELKGLKANKFFLDEVGDRRNFQDLPPLTISHLVKVIKQGEWFNPDII